MLTQLFQIALRNDRDVVQARQKAREIAASLGLDNQDQIRLATATSEMARNGFRYAHNAKVNFLVSLEPPKRIEVVVSDSGPGIRNLDEVLAGRYRSETGMGLGIIGTRRLMDEFEIVSSAEGTSVRMSKFAPNQGLSWNPNSIQEAVRTIQRRAPDDPFTEIERQNRELLKTLQELRSRQEELELLNRELEDTNRGVVALYAELDERADYLRRASELKTKFLSNVSHEFRTPLNSIVSLARLLLDRIDGELTPEQMRQVRYMESSARDLQEMVNDLLDLAKVEAGKIRMRPKRFDVHELFSALKGMLKPLLADNTSVDLLFEDASALAPLHTDEGKVSQILRNLISNALKFTPSGTVSVRARSIENRRVEFAVADTGIGIAPEHYETIFKEFSQVENPLQDRYRGTGLGLPLCRNLAMLLGGEIALQSELGRGSTFYLTIPSVYVGEAVSTEEGESLPAPEFHRMPVLYLEDNPSEAHYVEASLRETEFQPILASTVAQAELWTERHTPAAVLADVYVGEEQAWSFIDRIRDRNPGVPVIVTSAHNHARTAYDHGASSFLSKPIDRERLLSELRQLTPARGTRRLLIVDDNEVSRYVLRQLLSQPWLQISEVGNGTEALDALREGLPDAIILDLLMPDMSGFDILRTLRSRPETENLPVLIYTSKPLSDQERTQLENWGAAIVRKEDVSSRLSALPFLDWIRTSGINPQPSGEH
ncbi:ATP-binding protein [Occallatibacter riparius]|uniref:histidine kinase n=1 Tax=Occallatibacter riparius TaxID=1002689 RepID=A0A9J7BVX8_9BACT|nr:ATP-binding protein [Occallatibacter riparius]UWZ86792.1 response regulator [Occallatibacter riparius]